MKAAVFNASAVLSGWISQFSPARFAALVRYRHSSETGACYGVTGVLGHSSAVITQRYLWTGRADGSML